MTNISCLCSSCSKNCSSCVKKEMALQHSLTYVYLKNGSKVTYGCKFFAAATKVKIDGVPASTKTGTQNTPSIPAPSVQKPGKPLMPSISDFLPQLNFA